MTVTVDQFDEFFHALWGFDCFPWQRRLSDRVCAGDWPQFIDLPTASGKTACLDVAVFALAVQADFVPAERTVGRRIFFVVNRRVIVDEANRRASDIASKLACALHGKDEESLRCGEVDGRRDCADHASMREPPCWKRPVLLSVAEALRKLSGIADSETPPLDVAMLRGGIVRDNRWARSITQPTIITSTIDQVGSRLLFRGYGVTAEAAPVHAALIANDSTLLLDEAHISRPFVQTLENIQKFRGEEWADEPVRTPFHFVKMSATPGDTKSHPFRLDSEDKKRLAARHDKPKWIQLHAESKAKGKKALSELAATLASKAVALQDEEHRNIAIVVNRVATARMVHANLPELIRKAKIGDCDVYLAIGRMRPLDRDELTKRIQDQVGGARRDAEAETRPMFVVATQCLEVGADFDFDAMVCECASLDALRQRFGRLNRTGREIEARGVIVIQADQVKTEQQIETLDDKQESDDPIYGNALARTWNWLQSVAIEERVDFGVNAMNATLEDTEVELMLAPSLDAPVMFPAYVDMWAQTNPRPAVSPDVAMFLHGPQHGEPDVNVCWRKDLTSENEPDWAGIVSLCPPSTPECMPVPIGVFRKWLCTRDAPKDLDEQRSDFLDAMIPEADQNDRFIQHSALVWRGLSKKSEILEDSRDLSSGDTIVLPVDEGGWDVFGHRPDWAQADIAEKAYLQSRARVILRLRREWLTDWKEQDSLQQLLEWLGDDELRFPQTELRAALKEASKIVPEGEIEIAKALEELADKNLGLKFERYPDGKGVVLENRRSKKASSWIPAMDDGDDDASRTSRDKPVPLVEHLQHIRWELDQSLACLPAIASAGSVGVAADLHDLGKADERFQALLINGDISSVCAQPKLWAKSAKIPVSLAERQAAFQRSGLQKGFRHEMLSVQLAEMLPGMLPDKSEERDLVLHLIAAHHGHARPFAPVVIDDQPPSVSLAPLGIDVEFSAEERCERPPHRLDSGIPERFWKLTRRFGWWGLAYLETLLRLADQSASAREDADDYPESSSSLPITQGKRVPSKFSMSQSGHGLALPGLDGSNALAFLAALGAMRLLSSAWNDRDLQLSWIEEDGAWRPLIHSSQMLSEEEVLACLRNALLASKADHTRLAELGADLSVHPGRFRKFAESHQSGGRSNRTILEFLAAFGCDATPNDKGDVIQDTAFRTMAGAGHQHFLGFMGNIAEATTIDHLRKSLFSIWKYDDPVEKLTMRWDPSDDSRYALQWRNPSGDPQRRKGGNMLGANRLAIEGLPLFPTAPIGKKLATTGFRGHRSRDTFWTWPIWDRPVSLDVIRSLVALPELQEDIKENVRRNIVPIGIIETYRVQRLTIGKVRNFSPSESL